MVKSLKERWKWLLSAGEAWLVWAVAVGMAEEQAVRGPDLGVWLRHERAADGTNALVVADVVGDRVFARAGLREGDRIVSVNGRPIEREAQFVDAFLLAGNHEVQLVVERGGRQQTLPLRAAAVMDAMVPADPLYQAGLLVEEDHPEAVVVQRVFNLTPAFYAGLKHGDIITSINGQAMPSAADLTQALQRGGTLTLVVSRNGQTRQFTMMIWNDRSTRRRSLMGGSLAPAVNQPPSPDSSLRAAPNGPTLLAPPVFPVNPPALPSPPPAIPTLPPPGAVPNSSRS